MNTFQQLEKFNYKIIYITIDRNKKTWINPCVNFNIGFNEASGELVVIQNAEVCHVGDVLKYVYEELNDNNYLVFDVTISNNFDQNNKIYNIVNYSYQEVFNNLNTHKWYQHHIHYPRNLHFLTAITKKKLDDCGGFDIDYALGAWADDRAFLKIIENDINLSVKMIPNDKSKICGIHQYHLRTTDAHGGKFIKFNKIIHQYKMTCLEKDGKWPHNIDFNLITNLPNK